MQEVRYIAGASAYPLSRKLPCQGDRKAYKISTSVSSGSVLLQRRQVPAACRDEADAVSLILEDAEILPSAPLALVRISGQRWRRWQHSLERHGIGGLAFTPVGIVPRRAGRLKKGHRIGLARD